MAWLGMLWGFGSPWVVVSCAVRFVCLTLLHGAARCCVVRRVSVSLGDELFGSLQVFAVERRWSVSRAVAELVERGLGRPEFEGEGLGPGFTPGGGSNPSSGSSSAKSGGPVSKYFERQ